jgi:NAD(P)-dependent dehydrogenase (short-subunit alcohol dehydrogenase family)
MSGKRACVFGASRGIGAACVAQRIGAEGTLDLVLIATGILRPTQHQAPEKSWRALDATNMAMLYAVNTIGPALIAKHFLPLLSTTTPSIFAALSARVGSIADNNLGGWHSYRASKAGLNMLIRTLAHELALRNPHAIAVALHPGTVATELSAPFVRNVAAEKLFNPAQSAGHLLRVIVHLQHQDNGAFLAWDGSRIAY